MASTPSVNLDYPARCVIYYSVRLLDKHQEDPFNISAVKEVVQYASGDFEKVSLVGTLKWGRRAVTVFDYDNSDHFDNCRVLGFRYRPAIIPFGAPAEFVHSTVNKWVGENERHNLSFPRQSQASHHKILSEFNS